MGGSCEVSASPRTVAPHAPGGAGACHALEGDGWTSRRPARCARLSHSSKENAMKTMPLRDDTRAWKAQVWISFVAAVFLCAVGLSWLPGRDLDRAFMTMGYLFCLSAAF